MKVRISDVPVRGLCRRLRRVQFQDKYAIEHYGYVSLAEEESGALGDRSLEHLAGVIGRAVRDKPLFQVDGATVYVQAFPDKNVVIVIQEVPTRQAAQRPAA
jgi:hypothetical protein